MTLAKERLPGCNADSLDSYLRGLGFFLLAGQVESSVRAWWDDDGILWLASPLPLKELAAAVADGVRREPLPLRTPWRGREGRDRSFLRVRNDVKDSELDWLDACALARPAESTAAPTGRERSDRENNPLLGQGGSFGRSDPEAAYADALQTIRSTNDVSLVGGALVATLLGQPLDRNALQRLSTTKAVLGAYQSGRATGAGSSMRDVEPTRQPARSSVWDVVLVLTGLRLFRGVPTRRPDPRARVQASFPFLVRSRPIGTGPGGVHELRSDDAQAYELLAPLWSTPCAARTLRRLVSSARLRLPPTRARQLGAIAQDTLDGVLVQASRAAHGLGFDRLVRFTLVAGADPRYRFAVRRGEVHARALGPARLAVEQILPFLRELDRAVREVPPSLAIARRRLDDALATFAHPHPSAFPGASPSDAERAQEVLIALAALQTSAARALPERERSLEPARLSSEWFRHADDGSPAYRLARSLVAGLSDGETCLLRETLLPQRRDEGRFVLDATRTPPDLERVSDPLAVLVGLVLTALRRARPESLPRAASTSLSDLAWLLSGALGRHGERRLALLSAALAGIHPTAPPAARPEDPLAVGIGADVARLLLAAQPATAASGDGTRTAAETPKDALDRTTAIASLLLAGRVDLARTVADRELRRRELDLLPPPPRLAPTPRPTALAFAVLLPFDGQARSALERAVSVSPATPHQQGGLA